MSDALLLDTHIALWLDSGDEHLRPGTRRLIDECWRQGGTILLSAISVWEIALLVDMDRIVLDCALDAWIERFLARPGVASIPLDHRAAARAYRLHPLEHRDLADRLLIATAIEASAALVTYDTRILAFGEKRGREYGFSATR